MSLLVDSSVWVALADPADRHHADAREVLLDPDRPVAALDLTFFEVANAVGGKMGQPERARWLIELLTARCESRLLRVDPALVAATLEVAAEHGITAYDAAYVAAAERQGMTLVSGDLRDLVSKGLAIAPDAAV